MLEVEGGARALLTGRADGAELPRPPVGHRDADRARGRRAVAGAGGAAQILDTRKTTPGLRRLEKAAVAPAAASTTASGLYDAILIKENHSALAGGVGAAVQRARAARPDLPIDGRGARRRGDRRGAGRGRAAAAAGQHDARRGARGGRADRRAARRSRCRGGVTPETILVYATIDGVDYVSMGALTHSAPVLDLSLSLESLSHMTLLSTGQHPRPAGRGARARRRARRRDPRPQLPAARDPGGGRLRRRLARALAAGGPRRRRRDRLLRRALHGRDGLDPVPGEDRAAAGPRRRLLAGRLDHRRRSCAPGRPSTPARSSSCTSTPRPR